MERAGRHQVQNRLFAVHHQGVTGVVSPLESNDRLRVVGQPVHDLTLAFVSPLGSHHHHMGSELGCRV